MSDRQPRWSVYIEYSKTIEVIAETEEDAIKEAKNKLSESNPSTGESSIEFMDCYLEDYHVATEL